MPIVHVAVLSLTILAGSMAPPLPQPDAPGDAAAASMTASMTSRATEPILAMGDFTVGTPKSVPFVVRNAGTEPIVVTSIKGGCGCTTVSTPPAGPIVPGASITVQVTVDPGKRGGIDLVKPLYVTFEGGAIESVQITGKVLPVVSVVPEVIDVLDPTAAAPSIMIGSIDGAAFRVSGSAPVGVIGLPPTGSSAGRHEVPFDLSAWVAAGRPASIVLNTDLPGAEEIIIPIRSSEVVVMFRLPPATADAPSKAEIEATQDRILQQLARDSGDAERSPSFRLRLHRESGMLFVHGSVEDVDSVRAAVRALPESFGVRETAPGTAG